MMTPSQRSRVQWILLLGSAAAAIYYLAVYRLLTASVEAVDEPLQKTWRMLAEAAEKDGAQPSLDPAERRRRLDKLRVAIGTVRAAAKVRERTAFSPEIRERLHEPFQLIDFQNDRQIRLESLIDRSMQAKVTLDPGVIANFPDFTIERPRPELLWAQLGTADAVIETAVDAGVERITGLTVLPVQPLLPSRAGGPWLDKISIKVELAGSAANVLGFLWMLPLRREDAPPPGVPEVTGSKPELFIDGLLIRKGAADRPGEVVAEVRVSAFLQQEGAGQ